MSERARYWCGSLPSLVWRVKQLAVPALAGCWEPSRWRRSLSGSGMTRSLWCYANVSSQSYSERRKSTKFCSWLDSLLPVGGGGRHADKQNSPYREAGPGDQYLHPPRCVVPLDLHMKWPEVLQHDFFLRKQFLRCVECTGTSRSL